jgi:hypothetical protein
MMQLTWMKKIVPADSRRNLLSVSLSMAPAGRDGEA